MQFTATLVEYLVSGAVALIWLIPLANYSFGADLKDVLTELKDIKEVVVFLMLPFLYVMGMYIDTAATLLLHSFKKHVQKAKIANKLQRPYKKTVEVQWARCPEISQTMQSLVTRDRIARGVSLNSLIATIVFSVTKSDLGFQNYYAFSAYAITFISIKMWERYDRLTTEYKCEVLDKIHMSSSKPDIWNIRQIIQGRSKNKELR
jgi:hypothetical protein